MSYYGELTALVASVSFVSASTLFSYTVKSCTPLLLNIQRNSVSIALILLTLFLLSDSLFPAQSFKSYLLLSISGLSGIAAGDTLYFTALEYIGPRQTILIETLAPTFTGLISYLYFGTTLSFFGWIGILLTCFGIYIVVNDQKDPEYHQVDSNQKGQLDIELLNLQPEQQTVISMQETQETVKQQESYFYRDPKKKIIGLISAVVFTICQAIGIIASFDGQRQATFTAFQSALIRTLAGTVGVGLIFNCKKSERFQQPCKTQREYVIFFIACIFSYIGLWSYQTSISHTKPEVSLSIMATGPLISLCFSWFQGEVMKFKYFVGAVISIVGVSLIIWM